LSLSWIFVVAVDIAFQEPGTRIRLGDNPEEFIEQAASNPQLSRDLKVVPGCAVSLPQEARNTFENQLAVRERWYNFGREHPLASVPLDEGLKPLKEATSRYLTRRQIIRDLRELLADGYTFVADTKESLDLREAAGEMVYEARGFFADIRKAF